jgi:hypothetical protein
MEVNECSKIGFHLGDDQTQISIIARPGRPAAYPVHDVLNLQVSRCNAIEIKVKSIGPELNFRCDDSGDSSFLINTKRIAKLSFGSCRIRTLELDWETLFGEMKDFVYLFCRSGEALLLIKSNEIREAFSKKYETPQSDSDQPKYKIKLRLELISMFFERIIAVKIFRRFYSIWPVLISQIIILVGFATIYTFVPGIIETTKDGPAQISNFWSALYFSGVSFFTIGFGDLLPVGILRGAVLCQGFLGLASNAGLAVVLARRYSN